MKFLFPIAFLLLFLIPLILLFIRYEGKFQIFRKANSNTSSIRNALLFGIQSSGEQKILRRISGTILTLIYISGVIALAHPVTIFEKKNTLASGVDIVLVLDLSKSMLAEDITPNRIQSAKTAMSEFITSSKDNRIGIVGFAGKPFVFSPLTFDTASLIETVNNISVDSIRQEIPGFSGTAIGDGLLLATSTLEPEPERKKIIVLMTDGEANVGIDPTSVIPYLQSTKTTVYSIGIGDPAGTDLYTTNAYGVKEYFTDSRGVPIRATLDEILMKKLSEETGGKYTNIQSRNELIVALKEISEAYKKPLEIPTTIEYSSNIYWLLPCVIILFIVWFLVEQFDPRSQFRIIPWIGSVLRIQNIGKRISDGSKNYTTVRFGVYARAIIPVFSILALSVVLSSQATGIGVSKTIILLDTSNSMSVRDIDTNQGKIRRIDAAKELSKEIIQTYSNTEIAIVVFGYGTKVEVPFTTDASELERSIQNIQLGGLPGKTDIGRALQSAQMMLSHSSDGSIDGAQIYLLTDGEDTTSDSKTSTPYISNKDIVHPILIGTELGGTISIGADAFGNEFVKTKDGEPIVSKVSKDSLAKLLPGIKTIEVESVSNWNSSQPIISSNTLGLSKRGIYEQSSVLSSQILKNIQITLMILTGLGLIAFGIIPTKRFKNDGYLEQNKQKFESQIQK